MVSLYEPHSAEILQVHHEYLAALAEYVLRTESQTHLELMQRWFEKEVLHKRVPPSAAMFALLIKASLHMIRGPELKTTIGRYLDMVTDSQLQDELFHLSILSDGEVLKITQLNPKLFDSLSEMESVADQDAFDLNLVHEDPSSASAPAPNLRETEQKGHGLTTLKKSISIFSGATVPYPHHMEGSKAEKDRMHAEMRQKQMEHDAMNAAIERWRAEGEASRKIGVNTVMKSKSLGALLWDWHSAIKAALEVELREVEELGKRDKSRLSYLDAERVIYGPFLRLISVDKLAAIAILGPLTMYSTTANLRSIRLSATVSLVGRMVEDEALSENIQRMAVQRGWGRPAQRKKLRVRLQHRQLRKALAREVPNAPGTERNPFAPVEHDAWSAGIRVKVGAVLVSTLLRAAKIPVPHTHADSGEEVLLMEPAFSHTCQNRAGRSVGVVAIHSLVREILSRDPPHHAMTKHLPMIVPPRKWLGFSHGGYVHYQVPFMRTKGYDAQRRYVNAAAARGDLERVFAAVDVLGRTPWRVNRAVFDVMVEAWNSGESLGNIVPVNLEPEEPPEPAASASADEKRAWIKQAKLLDNAKAGTHSARCFQNFQLELARAYLNETFYFPHTIDFRGRAYPTTPYLNQMGADNVRGLLVFAVGKELGSDGLHWLKVHLANKYGYDKASFMEREDFVTAHLADIYDSARKPLKGDRWWVTAEDPFQCLAACIELANALDLPDPQRYRCHLPVHQDGTCNGLQHYAALGGDTWGAKQVNLDPGERPADIYSAVAELVEFRIAADAARGMSWALALEGKVTRKVVKQTVMTNVYGVTFMGAIEQVHTQLMDMFPHGLGVEPNPGMRRVAAYVARLVFRSIDNMFQGASLIQGWLTECAYRICRSVSPEQIAELQAVAGTFSPHARAKVVSWPVEKGKMTAKALTKLKNANFRSPVIWTSPLKLPVVQPYHEDAPKSIVTTMQQGLQIFDPKGSDPVCRRKQTQAFPPNFIHSLDATHMMLTALKCEDVGVSFGAVHDSFWTHPCDVRRMGALVRESFIRIHREDVVGRLHEEFEARYKRFMCCAMIREKGEVSEKIISWRKEFHKLHGDATRPMVIAMRETELLLEAKRQRLLHSNDAAERAEGKAMVTPASIFEESGDEWKFWKADRRKRMEADTEAYVGISSADSADDASEAAHDVGEDEAKAADDHEAALDDEKAEAVDDGKVDEAVDDDDETAEAVDHADDKPEASDDDEQLRLSSHGPLDTGKIRKRVRGKKSLGAARGKAASGKAIEIWMPLRFPPPPKKER
ncbi:MAG: DNA-directed RNA polymerase [Phylliscum demangeonii]|nr:MAG: DNA-directed RNA polymerase [Phylliscum demangeonii]